MHRWMRGKLAEIGQSHPLASAVRCMLYAALLARKAILHNFRNTCCLQSCEKKQLQWGERDTMLALEGRCGGGGAGGAGIEGYGEAP